MNFKFLLAVFVVAVALMPTAHSQLPNRGRMTPLRLKELKERLELGLRNTTRTSPGLPTVVREDSYPSFPDRGLTFSVTNLLTNAREIFGKNYWLAPDNQDSAEFVLDLGYEKTVNMVELVNTHNGYHRDRSMKEFKVFLSSDSSDGPWEEVLHQTLQDSRQQADPLPLQTFPFSARTAKFLKFNQISNYGIGGGLQYLSTTTQDLSNRDRMTPSRLKELKERLAARGRSGTCPTTTTSTASSKCQLTNIDLFGSDIRVIRNVPSWFACGQICTITPDCDSFTWNSLIDVCYPKIGVPKPTVSTGNISGTASCFNQQIKFTEDLRGTTSHETDGKAVTRK